MALKVGELAVRVCTSLVPGISATVEVMLMSFSMIQVKIDVSIHSTICRSRYNGSLLGILSVHPSKVRKVYAKVSPCVFRVQHLWLAGLDIKFELLKKY